MQPKIFFVLMALVLGALLPVQATINSRLSQIVSSPIVAAFISFAVGTVALFLYLVLSGSVHWQQISFRNSPWWIWTGGLLGTFFVAGITVLVPRLGVALAFGLVVAGQMAIAILFDQFGWLGTTIREISLGKITGAILLIIGVFLIRKF